MHLSPEPRSRLHSKTNSLLAAALLLALIMGGLLAVLCFPPLWRLDIGAPGDVRFLSGFYHYEYDGPTSFRWSSPQSQLRLYGTGPGVSRLSMRIHSDEEAATLGHEVVINSAVRTVARFRVAPGWRVYHTLLPAGATTARGFALEPLTLETSFYDPDTHDGRELGVPLDWIEVQRLTAVPIPLAVPVQRTLLLTAALLVLGAVLWVLNGWLSPGRTTAAAIRHVSVQVAGAAAALALWASINPFTLAWAWSAPSWAYWLVAALPGVLLALRTIYEPRPSGSGAKMGEGGGEGETSLPSESQRPGGRESAATRTPTPDPRTLLTVAVLAHALFLMPLPISLEGTIAWAILALPGVLLALLCFPDEHDPLVLTFLALAGGIVVAPLLLLVLQTIPGPAQGWRLLLACDSITIAAGILLWRRERQESRHPGNKQHSTRNAHRWLPLLLILLLAGGVRFAYLGNADFQGDEGQVMLMGAGVVQGYDDVLLLHRKGPMEILLVAAPMVLTLHTTEWVARLPFAVAGVACLMGAYLLAAHLFKSRNAGLLAAAVLALDGFFIGFSRIVQYQNVVLLMTIAALWLCWRFSEGGPRHYLSLAALCAAIGLLAHYDGIFGLPAMAWLVVRGGRDRGWGTNIRRWLRELAWTVAVGGGVLASFYIPFALHEHFQRTVDYLVMMRIGERDETGMFFNNLEGYFPLMSFYNTPVHVRTLAGLLVAGLLAWLWVYGRPRLVGRVLAGLLLAGSIIMAWFPEVFYLTETINWAMVALGLPIVGLIVSPATPLALRVVVVWFGFPFIAESFLIAEPNTHFYTMHIPAALLIGWFLVQATRWLRARQATWVLSPLLAWSGFVLLLTLPYLYLIFLQQYPEYERDFPDRRPDLYLASYGDKSPRGGYFGFPHRDGWKAVGELYRQGVLQGHYDSNQKSLITTWYIRDAPRGGPDPMYYFAVRAKGNLFIPDGYYPFGSVRVEGKRMLDMYSREPLTRERQYYDLEHYEARFDARPVNQLPIQWPFLEIIPRKIERGQD